MAEGYFIRKGDRTSCGGVVIEGDDCINMFGFAHALEGHGVTCGVTGKMYQIVGGLQQIGSNGRRVAGTLHSVSSCPCRAQLEHSMTWMTYDYKEESPVASVAPAAPRQSGNAAPITGMPLASPTEPHDEHCSGSFQLLDQFGWPCGTRQYALLHNGSYRAGDTLNDEGYCHICYSSNPVNLDIAISAPMPVLE